MKAEARAGTRLGLRTPGPVRPEGKLQMPFVNKTIRDRARRQVAHRVRAGEPCVLCQRPIDLTIKYPHDMSFTVHHIVATSRLVGRDHSGLWTPAHSVCNKRAGATGAGSVGRNSGVLG